MTFTNLAVTVTLAFAVAVVFCAVFGAAFYLLWKMLAPKAPKQTNAEADDAWPLLSLALPFSAGEAFDALGIVWMFVIGLLAVWALWSFIGPSVLRRLPRLADLLPLPCQHRDRDGRSVMYRERRDVGDVRDVMHWVCPECGFATVVVERTDAEHRLVQVAGAVRTPHAQPNSSPAPRLRTVNGGKR